MIASFIITFRETLEAALIVGVVLSYLTRTNQRRYNRVVYLGVASALLASILGGVLFTNLAGGFTGRAEEAFEGIIMLIGALLLTTMILWMMRQRHLAAELRDRVAAQVSRSRRLGLFALVFTAVLREGIETVIFLGAASFTSPNSSLFAGLGGVVTAILIGYAMFSGSMKLNLRRFFTITSVLLILFAAGLIAHGIHELQEANLVPTIIEHVWDVNPPVNPDGSPPLLHENGYVGSILTSLFGYNGNPSLVEVVSWAGYLVLVFVLWRTVDRRRKATELRPSENARTA